MPIETMELATVKVLPYATHLSRIDMLAIFSRVHTYQLNKRSKMPTETLVFGAVSSWTPQKTWKRN